MPLLYDEHHVHVAKQAIDVHGPVPPEIQLMPSCKGNERLFYFHNQQHSENHPLNPYGLKEFPPHLFSNDEEQSRKLRGIREPPMYKVGDWIWHGHGDDIFAAASTSVINSVLATHLEPPLRYISGELEGYFRSKSTNLADQPVPDMYHPHDRSTKPLPKEHIIAQLVRDEGYSLVIVRAHPDEPLRALFDNVGRRRPITRWSTGGEYEHFPPLYVGYAFGTWYSMLRVNSDWYKDWTPTRNSWLVLAGNLKGAYPDMPKLSKESLIYVAVLVQRLIREGVFIPDKALDSCVYKLAKRLAYGQSAKSALLDQTERWEGKVVITYEKLCRMIASSGDDTVRSLAQAYDDFADNVGVDEDTATAAIKHWEALSLAPKPKPKPQPRPQPAQEDQPRATIPPHLRKKNA